MLPRFTPEAMEANQALVDLLKRIAEQKKATPAQIALTWLLVQKPWVVPIPGTTKLHRLEENIRAANVRLTANDLAEIERAASAIRVKGERYPEQLMSTASGCMTVLIFRLSVRPHFSPLECSWRLWPCRLRLAPLEHRLAPVIDTDRAPLRAVRHQRREQIGELGVPTILPHEPLDVVPLAPPARFADDREDRDADLRQDLRSIAGHDGGESTGERSGNARPIPSKERPMSTKFVMFKMADGNEPILINPAHVCAAHQSGSAQVTVVMDYEEGGGYQNVEGNLKSVWETLTRTPVDLTWT
jgi:hypothetical protein